MGKGKSIYSATVLGNGRGGKSEGGWVRLWERFPPTYKANRRNKEHEMERGAGLQSAQVDFQKRNSLSISPTEGHRFRKKETKRKSEVEAKPSEHMIKPIKAIAKLAIQLLYTLTIMIIKQEPERII